MSAPLPEIGTAVETVRARARETYTKEKARATKATQDFEAVFLGMMLKQMRKSMAGEDALLGKSSESKMFQDMMDDRLAQQMSRSGSFGVAKAMMKSIERNLPPNPDAPPAKKL